MTHPYRKKDQFTLSGGGVHGMLVKVRCGGCRNVHRYHAADMIKLYGDIPISELEQQLWCETCDTRRYLNVNWQTVYGPDVGTLKVRRLVQIKQVRVPIWKEETI